MEKFIYLGVFNDGTKAVNTLWKNEILDANSSLGVFSSDESLFCEPEYRIHRYGTENKEAALEKLRADLSLLQIDEDDGIVLSLFAPKTSEAADYIADIEKCIAAYSPAEIRTVLFLFGGEKQEALDKIIEEDETLCDIFVSPECTDESMRKFAAVSIGCVEKIPEKKSREELLQKVEQV